MKRVTEGRKNTRDSRLTNDQRFGAKARAAMVAGMVAMAMTPVVALAASSQVGEMPEPLGQLEQGVGANEGMRDGDMPDFSQQGNQMPQIGQMPATPSDQMPAASSEEGKQRQSFSEPAGGMPDGQEQTSVPSQQQMQQPGQDGQMPGSQSYAPTQGEEPPAKPEDGEAPNVSDEAPSAPNDGEEPPAKPEGDQQTSGPAGDMGGEQFQQNGMLKRAISRLLELLNVKVDDSRIDELLARIGTPREQGIQQPGQEGQLGQQPGGEFGQQPGGQPTQAGAQQPGAQPTQAGAQQPGAQPTQAGNQQSGQPGSANNQSGQPGAQPIQAGNQQPGQPGSANTQPGQNGGQPGMPGGNESAPTSYAAANTLDADARGASYSSTANDENAVLVNGKTVSLSDVTVSKTGSTAGENADFYGTNAAILAYGKANLSITDANVSSDGTHANGVFSYGQGTSVTISDSTITTSGNNSGGLMTTGGASITASNLDVSTSGNSSAAIRSDRGGGTINATAGSYATSGVGSPAIYSTADIKVSDATLSSANSEAVVIEGGNSVTLTNVNATGNNAKLNGQSTEKTNVLIYQSMSGDASEGSSSFTATGGSLTAQTGSMFHVTNATTTISLSGVALQNASDSDVLLSATADAWGTTGKNGGHATVNLSGQTANGNIVVDKVSSVSLNLANNSTYTGAISNEGTVEVTLEAGSTWTLTSDSYVSSLSGDTSGIDLNGHTLYVNGVAYTK